MNCGFNFKIEIFAVFGAKFAAKLTKTAKNQAFSGENCRVLALKSLNLCLLGGLKRVFVKQNEVLEDKW